MRDIFDMIMSCFKTVNAAIDAAVNGEYAYFLSNPRLFQIEIISECIYPLKETIYIPFKKPAEYWLMGYDTMIQRGLNQ